MNIHENARTTPASRALLVHRITDEKWSVCDAASAAGVSRQTAYKWLQRQRENGARSLRDRPSRAHHLRHALPAEWTQIILYLRQFRQPARVIGGELGIARSTVSAVLARHGVGAHRALEPVRPVCRYERRRPSSFTSRSTTTPGLRSLRSFPMSAAPLVWDSCVEHAPGFRHTESPFGACSPITERAIAHTTSGVHAWSCACDTCEPSRALRKPTAKPSGLSKACCESGPTGAFGKTVAREVHNCSHGSSSTMDIDLMPVLAIAHPSVDGRSVVNNGRRNHS